MPIATGNSDYSCSCAGSGSGRKAEIQTCFVDKTTGELLCDAEKPKLR